MGAVNKFFALKSAFPNLKKMGKFATSIERPKARSVSASGGASPPHSLTSGSAPGPSPAQTAANGTKCLEKKYD